MPSERRLTIQPADWWAAWETEADKEGLTLAAWMGKQCNKALPKSIRSTLSERGGRGRPKPDAKHQKKENK